MPEKSKAFQLQDVAMFALLIVIGLLGRLFQPEVNFTPIAAVTVFAGFYFRQLFVAFLVPISVLTLSNLLLPNYSSMGVLVVVFAAMLLPVLIGRMLKNNRKRSYANLFTRLATATLGPAVLFFLITNAAVWFFSGAALGYAPSLAGLLECYAMGVPFFRSMLAGDCFFLTAVFGSYFLATHLSGRYTVGRLTLIREKQN